MDEPDGSNLGCAMMKWVVAFLFLFLGVSVVHAQNSTLSYIGLKDAGGGLTACFGDNSHDDTACIQAHIDYAFNHNLIGVYCPAGDYVTSSPIYFDPPGNLRSNLSAPTNFAFSASFFGDPAAGGNYQGCQLRPNFNNAVALYVGPGQGMRVSDIAVIGPSSSYRGAQSSAGVGIGLTGGSGGSSINLVENTYVANFYALYETDANGACCLNDSNTFRKVAGDNGYYGIQFAGTQTDINDVVEPRLAATIDIDSELSRQVTVFGGNLSAESGRSGSFTISSTSGFTKVADGDGFDYSFTTTIAAPDGNVNTVYNSYEVSTAHFGVIPLTLTAWNSGTSVGTFQIWIPWVFANYGVEDLTTMTDMQAEVAAATTLYATERVVVAQGVGIALDGTHIENPSACTSLFIMNEGFAGATANEVKNPFFNYDPALPGAALSELYCQRSFPFIGGSQQTSLKLQGGYYGATSVDPLVIDAQPLLKIAGSLLSVMPSLDMRVYDSGGYAYSQLGGYGQFNSEGRGAGTWDNDYFVPPGLSGTPNLTLVNGELTSPFCGYEPCTWTTPNLTPATWATVCPSPVSGGGSYGATITCGGSLGSLGSYVPIACRTAFKSVDWNTGAIGIGSTSYGLFKRSSSCPGFSWGQNLVNASVGETVTWSYKGQSDVLYLDAKSLTFMFPGLGIILTVSGVNSGNPIPYTVTGVFPDLGYITVMDAANNSGAPLQGTKTTVYSCASTCTIGQAPFVWAAY